VAVCNSRITVLVELVKTKTTKTDHAEARPTLASPQLTAPLTLTPQSNTKPTTGERVDTDDISEGSHLSDPIAIQMHALRRETGPNCETEDVYMIVLGCEAEDDGSGVCDGHYTKTSSVVANGR
jgi:hypothetical protein